MKYLSIDLEATGLDEDCLIIEFAAVPFDGETGEILTDQKFETYIACPSFEDLAPNLNSWVAENNESIIRKAHETGITLKQLKVSFEKYLKNENIQKFFGEQKIILFGKSLNAIDLPFLNRDLGWNFIRDNFSHRQQDLSSVVYFAIDTGILPPECESGSKLMNYFEMGEVVHTALADAINTAKLYMKIKEKLSHKF